MAGKIDKDGTIWCGESLELVASTEIWMGSFHVADIRPEVGRGTRLSHVEALLENAREYVPDLRLLRDRLETTEAYLDVVEKQRDELQCRLEKASAEIKRLKARKK